MVSTANDFFCAAGTGGVSGNACVGTSAKTNIINPKYFDATGATMLRLLPMPNNVTNPSSGAAWSANNASDTLPQHTRRNYVFRTDYVQSSKVRYSFRWLRDRDDSTTYNAMTPGCGATCVTGSRRTTAARATTSTTATSSAAP